MKRQGVYKKTPQKSKKLKMSKIPKKDLLRNRCFKKKENTVQNVANPLKSSSHCFTEKPINSIVMDSGLSVFKDRKLDFSKKELTNKVNGSVYKGYISDKKLATDKEIPIKLNMMSVSELK